MFRRLKKWLLRKLGVIERWKFEGLREAYRDAKHQLAALDMALVGSRRRLKEAKQRNAEIARALPYPKFTAHSGFDTCGEMLEVRIELRPSQYCLRTPMPKICNAGAVVKWCEDVATNTVREWGDLVRPHIEKSLRHDCGRMS